MAKLCERCGATNADVTLECACGGREFTKPTLHDADSPERVLRRGLGPIVNCYLPAWAHRLANGILATCFVGGWALVGWNELGPRTAFGTACKWLAVAAVPLGIICMLMPPSRFSIVEGIGGDVGYDGLDSPEERGEDDAAEQADAADEAQGGTRTAS